MVMGGYSIGVNHYFQQRYGELSVENLAGSHYIADKLLKVM